MILYVIRDKVSDEYRPDGDPQAKSVSPMMCKNVMDWTINSGAVAHKILV